jgi:biopolymer transport protein ExbD
VTGREWGWRPAQAEGIWRHGARWTKPLFAAAPWITLALLLVMFGLLGDTLTTAPGVVFDLPAPVGRQAAAPGTTMLVLPSANVGETGGTLVFYDDARYVLGDQQSVALLREQLLARVQANPARATLLVLADRRVATGELMRLVDIARESGMKHVQIAEKRE